MNPYIDIYNRRISTGESVYIVAEMSANHHQSLDQAVRIIETAKESGADAIKLQTYTPDTLTISCNNDYFRIGKGTLWEGRSLHDLYAEAYTPWEWQPKLKKVANDLGMDLFSTPFDYTAIEFLRKMNVPAYKIASFELVDLQLLRDVAHTGKPLIISTGMATFEEIEEAVRTVREAGGNQLALLKCTSAYPARPEDMNLRTIPYMAEIFKVPVGLSDHNLDITVPITAVALGACIIEKHFTLSRSMPGPDSAFSLEPQEFKAMVDAIRTTEKALGGIRFETCGQEISSRVFRRSLFVVEDMEADEVFTEQNVRSIRPGYGLHPRFLKEILGRKASHEIARGTPLSWDHIL